MSGLLSLLLLLLLLLLLILSSIIILLFNNLVVGMTSLNKLVQRTPCNIPTINYYYKNNDDYY